MDCEICGIEMDEDRDYKWPEITDARLPDTAYKCSNCGNDTLRFITDLVDYCVNTKDRSPVLGTKEWLQISAMQARLEQNALAQ